MHALRFQRGWLSLLLTVFTAVSLSGLSSNVFAADDHPADAADHAEHAGDDHAGEAGGHGGEHHDTSVPMKPETDLVIFTIILAGL